MQLQFGRNPLDIGVRTGSSGGSWEGSVTRRNPLDIGVRTGSGGTVQQRLDAVRRNPLDIGVRTGSYDQGDENIMRTS